MPVLITKNNNISFQSLSHFKCCYWVTIEKWKWIRKWCWRCYWVGEFTFQQTYVDLQEKFIENSTSALQFNRHDIRCCSKLFLELNVLIQKCLLMMQMCLDSMSHSNFHVTITFFRWWWIHPSTFCFGQMPTMDSNFCTIL